jgi:hypothetical protein
MLHMGMKWTQLEHVEHSIRPNVRGLFGIELNG